MEAAEELVRKTDPRFSNKVIIMDDETYCYVDPEQISGKSSYSTSASADHSDSVEYKGSTK